MEKDSVAQILKLGEQLAREGHVSTDLLDQLAEDIQVPGRLEVIQKLLSDRSVKQLLRMHMLSTYSIELGDTVMENRNAQLTYEQLKRAADMSPRGLSKFVSSRQNLMANFVDSSLDALKTKFQTLSRFLSLMLCSRKEKTIQNYFGRLIELLLGTADYAYARWNSEDPHSKIEYYNSSLSYLTVYLKDEPNYRILKELFSKIGRGVTKLEDNDTRLKQAFQLNLPTDYLCQVIDQNGECLIFLFKTSNTELCGQLAVDSQLATFYELLLSEAAETLHASKFEVLKQFPNELSTQYALKSILNLLEFCMKVDARVLQLTIEEHYKPRIKFSSISELSQQLGAGSKDMQEVQQAYEQYCSRMFVLESEVNRFKAQTLDTRYIYFNFNKRGELGFVSNKLPSSLARRLLQKGNQFEEVTVFDLFSRKTELLSRIKAASEGRQIDDSCKFMQDGRIVEAVLFVDQKHRLDSFYCKVNMKKRKEFAQRSDTSFKNLSSNSIHSTDSEKEITTKVREGTGINRDAQRLLVEQEQANPGVSKTGWLEAFMKNDVLEKYKRSPFSSKKNVNEGVKPSSKKRMSVTILYEPSSAVAQTLMLIDRFDLNLLEVDKDHLIPLAKTMLLKLRFSKETKLEDELLDNFLRELSTKYGKYGNPFHNFIHGVNVMHMCYLLSNLDRNREYLSDINIFALVFSGLCHDVGHPGRTNQFEINSQSKKALRYNDRSPLENYHASTSFKILLKPENNFLQVLKKEQLTQIRKEFVANILATDIKEHFPMVNNFEAKMKSPKGFEKIPADVELTTTFLIHTSDFAGACMTFNTSRKWAELVNQEFSAQYAEEGELGIAQTPYMKNLEKEEVMAQNEAGFLKVIVRPLFKLLNDLHDKEQQVRRLLKNIDENMLTWEKIVADYKSRTQSKN